tara:strand:+ start:103 stop:540 length:438 start_codon:yes stop_codon:yes gene_type:complete
MAPRLLTQSEQETFLYVKAKGTQHERAVADYLKAMGFPNADRATLTGGEDRGDLIGVPNVAFECRNTAKIDLAKNVDDANSRAEVAGVDYGVTVIKRRGKNVRDAYVAMDLETFVKLYKKALNGADGNDQAIELSINILENAKES